MAKLQLKSCPFCGGKAFLEDCGDCSYFVKCAKCGIIQEHLYRSKAGAVNAWNRRANTTTNFIRFKANGGTVLVNAERIAFASAHIDRYERDVPVFDEDRTNIFFSGSDIGYIIVDEPFQQVCEKLTRGR